MAIAAGSRELAHLDPLHRAAQAPPSSSGQDRPSLHLSERSSPVKNRKREICTSGSVRGEGGNILTYSALELRRLLHGEVGGLGPLQDLVHQGGSPPVEEDGARPVRH